MKKFDKNNKVLCNQYDNIEWIEESGLSEDEVKAKIDSFTENKEGLTAVMAKTKTYEFLAKNARIAIDAYDIFQDKLFGRDLIAVQRRVWESKIVDKVLKDEHEKILEAFKCGAYLAVSDFGHTSPNSELLLKVGLTGILDRVNKYSQKDNLTDKQKEFYETCRIWIEATLHYIKRLAKAIKPYNEENAEALLNIAKGAPSNIYEAMQLLIVYFFMHDYIGGTRVRTLGRLDVLLTPFYKNDIEKGVFTKAEIKEMIKFFFNKFWTAKVPFDLPLCLGGIDENGNEVTNELTYLLVETYNELNIYSPKIHIRVSDKTPEAFVKLVLKCIRGGNSSFVFVNDNTIIESLKKVGIKEKDAKNYVPIGCYEPAVWGKEMGCTGCGGVNLAKAVEFAVTGGKDFKSGRQISVETKKIETYEDFISVVKEHLKFMIESGMNYTRQIEKYYGEIGPDPMHSAMYDRSVEKGIDVYEGGAEYNNTSYYCYFIGSLVDSVCAVKRLVFEEKMVGFDELCEVLKNNWENNEELRLAFVGIPEKYGNNNAASDEITKELAHYCASLIDNKPNSRGGVFKASLFSIDYFVGYGKKTMATPDGRFAEEILSKNLCATVGQDKNGVTALINSATKIDHTLFPNGTVLDVVLHPSVVKGDTGLDAFYTLLMVYMKNGGMALHGNVFNPEDLKNAQKEPEKYKTLQVRVCGWNAYFIDLTKAEQDAFIKQAEASC